MDVFCGVASVEMILWGGVMVKNKNCIALVCNEGFLESALFVAQSLVSCGDRNYDVVICSSDNVSGGLPDSVLYKYIETEDFTRDLPENSRLKKYTYWRIPAIEELAGVYEMVLYLDTDIFINAMNVGEIFSLDMGDHILAAVLDVHQSVRSDRIPREFKALGMPSKPYFNAGVLLVQCYEWRKQRCFERILHLSKLHSDVLFCHDQSLLNLMVDGRWIELSPLWNWQYSARNNYLAEILSPRLIHFAGSKKLWHSADGSIPRRYWDVYQSYLRDSGRCAAGVFPALNAKLVRSMWQAMVKNLWYFKRNIKHASRFSHPLSVVIHENR